MYWHPVTEIRHAAKHPTVHRTHPYRKDDIASNVKSPDGEGSILQRLAEG